LDNKGAIFIPGGLIYQDVDDKQISYEPLGSLNEAVFRQKIRASMHYDNASLLFPDGLANSVNSEPFKNHNDFKERDSEYTKFLL
jgi:hypothetical protein